MSNFSVAALAQGVAMVLSVITALLVPKVLGVEEFGYWQLFVFYAGYVAVFHLGLDDGVYLIYGGTRREAIDKARLGASLKIGMSYQALEAVALAAYAISVPHESARRFVLLSVCVFILLSNFNSYCSHVFQAMNETKLASASIVVDRVAFLIPLLALLTMRVSVFEPYVLAFGFSKTAACLFCAYHMRDFRCVDSVSFGDACRDVLAYIRVGSKLLVANMASMLILGVARYAVDAQWGIESFGQFSLVLTMENFFITFVSQLSMVLFPALREAGGDERIYAFDALRKGLALLLPAIYIAYFPLYAFVDWWLPMYQDALVYLPLVLPICVFESRMSLLGGTYFKVMRGEAAMLFVNLVSVAASAAGVVLGIWIVGSIEFVIVWVVVVLAVRSIWSECWSVRAVGADKNSDWLATIAFTFVFEASVYLINMGLAFAVIGAMYAVYLFSERKYIGLAAGRLGLRARSR